jgi:acetyl-CoA carboxylase carboxyl transferase subunit beta
VNQRKLAERQGVCLECGSYFRLGAGCRVQSLVDEGTFVEHHAWLSAADPLEFTDKVNYPTRITQAQSATGLSDAVVTGTAQLGGHLVAMAVLDFRFLGGSMGSVVGEKVALAAEQALATSMPLIVVSASGGARMQEGVLSLLQMAKTAAALRRLREARVPFFSVLTDPVYGGVAASFASLGDIIVAEAGARAGFAGPQVIEQTIRQNLPPGFQTAQFLLEHGHIDRVVPRQELRSLLHRLVACHAAAGRRDLVATTLTACAPAEIDAYEAVRLARTPGRPTVREYIAAIFTDFVELHGDRTGADDAAVAGGLAWLDRTPVMVLGTAKGSDTAENVRNNFGMPHPSGYRKTMRLMTLAERLGVPVITLVDTPGAYPGLRAEEENQSGAIAECLALSSGLQVPVLTVVTGEGGSGGALALAVGDRLLMQENAVLSVISPEGCATILFADAARAPQAARSLRLRATDLRRLGVADELVPEPPGGSHTDPGAAARLLGAHLRSHLADLLATDTEVLLATRYERLRSFGEVRLLTTTTTKREAPTWR